MYIRGLSMTEATSKNYFRFHPEGDANEPPPIFGNFFEGWSSMFSNKQNVKEESPKISSQQQYHPLDKDQDYEEDDFSSVSTQSTSFSGYTTPVDVESDMLKRKSSVEIGRKVMSELLKDDNVSNAIHILQQAMDHIQMVHTEKEDKEDVSKIYSQIIQSLCDPNVAHIVDELSKANGKEPDIQESILWRLFTKVVESGYVLEVMLQLFGTVYVYFDLRK